MDGAATRPDRLARTHHVRRVDRIADHLQREIGFDAGAHVEIAVVYQRPAAVGALNPAQVIRDLGFQYGVDRLAEVMTKQHILGGNGGIGLQFEDPMPIRLSIAKQRARCRRDARLQGGSVLNSC